MAKDLTQMPTDKLFKRIEGAVAELQRRFVPVGDVLPRTQRVAPGIRVQAATPARYRPVHWGEFRRQRALGDYGDYGEEIQVSRFRRQ